MRGEVVGEEEGGVEEEFVEVEEVEVEEDAWWRALRLGRAERSLRLRAARELVRFGMGARKSCRSTARGVDGEGDGRREEGDSVRSRAVMVSPALSLRRVAWSAAGSPVT